MIYESLLLLSWTLQRELEQISVNKGAVLFTTFQLFFAVEMVILIEIHTILNLMGGWKISLCVFCIDFSWSCKPTVTCWILCELWFIQSYTIEIYNRPFFACKIFTNVIMWMHLKRIVHRIAHPPCHSKSWLSLLIPLYKQKLLQKWIGPETLWLQAEERNVSRFGMTRGWVKEDYFNFWVDYP